MTDRIALRGASWREFDEPVDRLTDLPDLPADAGEAGTTRNLAAVFAAAIDTRVFRQGEQLPVARPVANRYKVSSDTVRKAYQQVCKTGRVRYVRGLGYFVIGPL